MKGVRNSPEHQQPEMDHEPAEHDLAQSVIALVEPPVPIADASPRPKRRDGVKRYRYLAEAMPPIVWTARPDGYLDYYNQRWFDYTGMTFEQTQRWGWLPILHTDDVQRCQQAWSDSINTAQPFELECRFRRIDGIYHWHLIRALPVYDGHGKITLWVGTCTDINAHKQTEAELARALADIQRANAELEKINRMQSDFVSMVSHEFRSTLTSIQGFSELLRDEDFSQQVIKEYAADINADARRLGRLINELLDLNRIKTGQMTLHVELVDINVIIREVAERLYQGSADRQVHPLILQLTEDLPSFSGDRDKLTQVITNLLTNAIKYSPAGGEIIVASRLVDNRLHVSVQDHGIGIPAHELEHIFEPYSRIPTPATKYIEGSGIGLNIVRQIMHLHAGEARVTSVEGVGSTFYLAFPLTTEHD